MVVVESNGALSLADIQIQAVATIFLGSAIFLLRFVDLYSYVRTSAAFAAASLGEELLGSCEALPPSVRPPDVGVVFLLVPDCFGRAGGVEPT